MQNIKDPAEILEMSLEDLVTLYVDTREQEEDIAAQKTAVKQEIIERLKKAKLDGTQVGNYAVTKFKMITFATTLEDAKKYGAVKTEEKPDTTILRKLFDKGEKIPGANEREELRVKEIEPAE